MRKISSEGWRSADHSVLRTLNEAMVLNIIRERQPIARISIAELSGLEPGTITRILQRFLDGGIISEVGSGPTTPAGGRKPRYVTLNPTKRCAVGVEIGPRETLLALSDFNGQIVDFRRIANRPDAESTLAGVADQIQSLTLHADSYDEFGGVGVGLIGLVDRENGTILEGENLGWPEPIEVGQALRARIKDVPFFFENSARLSALGEIWFGDASLTRTRHMVFLDVAEGVGTGIIIDGELYRGFRNTAGEFGHVCVDPGGPKCSCGSYGCLEVMASDNATIQRYLDKCGASNGHRLDMKLVVELAKRGDSNALGALRETAHYLGLGLAPIIYGLGPERIIVGGTFVQAWPLLVDAILEACAQRVSQPFLSSVRLEPSTMQVKASLMGAIALVLARDFAAPEVFQAS